MTSPRLPPEIYANRERQQRNAERITQWLAHILLACVACYGLFQFGYLIRTVLEA